MFGLKCSYSRSRLTAYINGELPPPVRNRVARHLDTCDACYRVYRQERDIQRQLGATLPVFGRPSQAQLDRVWAGVQRDLQTGRSSGMSPVPRLRYGLMTLGVLFAMVLPVLIGSTEAAGGSMAQVTPDTLTAVTAHPPRVTETSSATPVALASPRVDSTDETRAVQATPVMVNTPDMGR